MGIALLVYYAFFKVLGIILFAVEMTVFIAGPVVKEKSRPRWPLIGGVILLIFAWLFFP